LPPQAPLRWIVDWMTGAPSDDNFLGVMQEGSGLLYSGAKWLVFGRLPPQTDVALHPVAFAAWAGLLVTTLNLLPIGQLDGGHVLFAVMGTRARWVGRVVIGVLLVLGLTSWLGWWLWALLGWKVVKTTHPPVDDPGVLLDRPRQVVAWVSLAMFVVTFMPVPISLY
jgi:membrane-associated protease RseP (regulator of RpoE activity)